MSTTIRQLERAAIQAHRRGERWADFWPSVAQQVQTMHPWNREAYRRTVDRLLHLLVCGNDSGMEPAGDGLAAWDRDDQAKPDDTGTAARLQLLLPLGGRLVPVPVDKQEPTP